MTNPLKRHKKLFVILFAIILFVSWLLWANTALTANETEFESNKIPSTFNGFKIAHVSDLHNATFGKDNKKLLGILEEAEPDIIAVTGDIVDSRRTDIFVAIAFLEKAVKIAPVYYVTGNHESRINDYDKLEEAMKKLGVKILENEKLHLYHGDDYITLCGIKDPTFMTDYPDIEKSVSASMLKGLCEKISFTLLLSHKPEFFDLYVNEGFDLVLSGHAHGGQFRLPFVGGLFAPGQGVFPEYDSGLYKEKGTAMLVSRGLGNSLFPLRFCNRPEIIIITLKETD